MWHSPLDWDQTHVSELQQIKQITLKYLSMIVFAAVPPCVTVGWRMLSMNMLRLTTILRSVESNLTKSSSTRRHIR